MEPRYAIGLDLGGTDLKAGLVSGRGEVVRQIPFPPEGFSVVSAVIASRGQRFVRPKSPTSLNRFRNPATIPKSVKTIVSHGLVPSHLSSVYPIPRPMKVAATRATPMVLNRASCLKTEDSSSGIWRSVQMKASGGEKRHLSSPIARRCQALLGS